MEELGLGDVDDLEGKLLVHYFVVYYTVDTVSLYGTVLCCFTFESHML